MKHPTRHRPLLPISSKQNLPMRSKSMGRPNGSCYVHGAGYVKENEVLKAWTTTVLQSLNFIIMSHLQSATIFGMVTISKCISKWTSVPSSPQQLYHLLYGRCSCFSIGFRQRVYFFLPIVGDTDKTKKKMIFYSFRSYTYLPLYNKKKPSMHTKNSV